MTAPPLPEDHPFPYSMTFDEQSMRRQAEWRASPSGLRWRAAYLQHELTKFHAELGAAALSVGAARVPALPPAPAEIADEVARHLSPATRAEFITPGNAKAVTGQDWRWVTAEAQRLGVPVGGTGKKRIVDIEAFRAALAAKPTPPLAKRAADIDPVEQIRRMIGSTRTNRASHGH
ncbi:MAG: hypothetical protein L6Q84_35445 [Polyangiaceae bacterium]|nr:hypothetical protein [Polyangiaceae bacterium]